MARFTTKNSVGRSDMIHSQSPQESIGGKVPRIGDANDLSDGGVLEQEVTPKSDRF